MLFERTKYVYTNTYTYEKYKIIQDRSSELIKFMIFFYSKKTKPKFEKIY